MNYEIIEALGQIARKKDIDNEFIIETLKEALAQAAQKKLGQDAHVEIEISESTGSIEMYHVRTVVKKVSDPVVEISVDEAVYYQKKPQVGAECRIELPFKRFGRNAIQTAKQIIVQRIKEAERQQIFEEYSKRGGELVTGSVQQIERGNGGVRNIIVNFGRAEGLLPASQGIKREKFQQGELIKAVILEVRQDTKGPQIILTRSHPEMLRQLFAKEVHEIEEGIVEIKVIAREAGERAKVAVFSHYDNVDAVGACVGIKGSRVQNIVQEFSGERIDIVPWSSEPKLFVSKALSPAKVSEVLVNSMEDKSITVVVKDDQYSLAIGKAGQNARLAARLTGFRIDIIPESEYLKAEEHRKALEIDIMDMPGVTQKICNKLLRAGYEVVQDLTGLEEEDLMEIPGIGKKTAERVLTVADLVLEEVANKLERKMTEAGTDGNEESSAGLEDSVVDGVEDGNNGETAAEEKMEEKIEEQTEEDVDEEMKTVEEVTEKDEHSVI